MKASIRALFLLTITLSITGMSLACQRRKFEDPPPVINVPTHTDLDAGVAPGGINPELPSTQTPTTAAPLTP